MHVNRIVLVLVFSTTLAATVCAGLGTGDVPPAQGTVAVEQLAIARVNDHFPRLPQPYMMRDWKQVAQDYYRMVCDPSLKGGGNGHFPIIQINENHTFDFGAYLCSPPKRTGGEGMNCFGAIVGGTVAGLDMTDLYGFDFIDSFKHWYDARHGLYKVHPDNKGPVVHSGVYGYWPVMLSVMIMNYYQDDADFKQHFTSTAERFYDVCVGHGFPDNPDYFSYGFNFDTLKPDGRKEPMNRFGNASGVAWIEFVGWKVLGTQKYLDAAESAIQWHLKHPARYECTHMPGPVVVARLNAELGRRYDLGRMMDIWFGELGDGWKVTAGTHHGGVNTDGLNGADHGDTRFYAFSMESYQGPAWLVPVVRYDQRYARAIGIYAVNAANSCRILQGYQMDWDHQDHKDWKDQWDPNDLLSYEGVLSEDRGLKQYKPYASGDPVLYGWGSRPKVPPSEYYLQKKAWFSNEPFNISLYMGNHIGMLGGIVSLTNVEGILQWDCVKTDYYHDRVYPTYLYYNPHTTQKTVEIDLACVSDLYDTVSKSFVARHVSGHTTFTLDADTAAVIVVTPPNGHVAYDGNKMLVDGIVVSYR
ncbi:MAG: hypothetical protein K9N55_09890 [Phycisphaerae bacterium]|nr:hypothetical protein [Phycisphaerae bacterium]